MLGLDILGTEVSGVIKASWLQGPRTLQGLQIEGLNFAFAGCRALCF